MKVYSGKIILILIGIILGVGGTYLAGNFTVSRKNSNVQSHAAEKSYSLPSESSRTYINSQNRNDIETMTQENVVIKYIKDHHSLPDYYITKNEAKKLGWIPSKANLCDAVPGKAIGGDHFSNRERQLPKNEEYFEADVNYSCGNRNADRIVFTKDGDVYLTKNHYRSFEKK